MAKRAIHVWYNEKGDIVATGYLADGAKGLTATPLESEGSRVIHAETEEEEFSTLAASHKVDVAGRRLVPKDRRAQ